MAPSRDEILEEFNYSEGCLIRKVTGKRGYLRPDGYVYTRVKGRSYGEHRLIHFLFTGDWPEQVDHINGNRSDNRHENLRAANHAENCFNRKPVGKNSKGCYWQSKRKKWIAQIGYQGKRITIGYYDTEQQASAAYREKSELLHGEFSRIS
ncbi:Fis family transcriptional regulator [Escherichia sp. ESNIH1]|uniref:HNH endonuclease n=1 Tax=Escherichia sp. ESNIH1 TaxID=1985876 RepID=UPI000CDE228E|nr:HNH endonuclease [Escherichia sp. ESNIH1]POU03593.1 Fis family transcriptional regulator [Escherichia sp. ESNIH1]